MLGKTHFVLGMASALLITQPKNVSDVITAMVGGAIGGWIVDVDIKNRDNQKSEEKERENIYDAIIDILIILAFVAVDFFIGKGMCKYVIDNWGIEIWGSLFGLIIISLIGLNTKHRSFTHSFLAMAIFTRLLYSFCRPIAIPFLIGYASHLLSDFFNKKGIHPFFPLKINRKSKKGLCLELCSSNGKVNKVLFWVSLAIDIILGSFLFTKGMIEADKSSGLISAMTEKKLFGLYILQIYLILINCITFSLFQKRNKLGMAFSIFQNKSKQVSEGFDSMLWGSFVKGQTFKNQIYDTPEAKFETWLLNILVFLGGGAGMFVSLVMNKEIPSAYNANWWSFCYASIMLWFTIYCFVINPFGFVCSKTKWLSMEHISLVVYLLGINIVSALVIYSFRKKRLKDTDFKHTFIIILGALGGTTGAILATLFTHNEIKFHYVTVGFFFMIISQIMFILYMMVAGVF